MSFLNSTGFMLVSFVFFTALVAFISWWVCRGQDESTEGGYYLAGRSLPGIVIAGSLIMTDLSAVQLIGNNGQSVIAGMTVFAAQGLGCSGMFIAAIILVPRYLKSGIATMPEFYEKRYNASTRRLVSIIMLISYVVCFIPSAIYAGAEVFITIFHVDEIFGISTFAALTICCVLIAIIGSIYALFGGLKAITVSDTINGAGMIIGGIAITLFGFIFLSSALNGDGSLTDGIDKFLHTDPAMMNAISEASANEPWWPWPVLITGLVVNNVYFWGCDQAILQRAFGARSMAHAQKGMIYAGLLTLITPFFLILPGIIAKFAFPDIDFMTNGDSAFPLLIDAVLPKPLLGFFAACVFGAVLSTFNSYLNSACSIFSLDVYQEVINPQADDKTVVLRGKQFGFIVAVVATVISPFLGYADGIFTWVNMLLGLFNTPILVITLFAIYSKRAPRNLAVYVIPTHIILYGLCNYVLPNFFPVFGTIHYLYYTFFFFIVDTLIALLVTRMYPLAEDFNIPDNPPKGMDLKPWKYRYHMIAATLALIAVFYIAFSPLGFGKSDETTWERYQTTISQSAEE